VQSGSPSPAWAIAGDRLVFAGSARWSQNPIGKGTGITGLAELPAVASRLKTEPVMVTYQDTKAHR